MRARESSSNRDGAARLAPGLLLAIALLAPVAANADGIAHGRPVPILVPGDRILLLYDSTDGTSEARNPLSGEVKTTLERMGFLVSWQDVGHGVLPDRKLLPGLRAVVTGFVDAKLDHAADYAAFVRDAVAAGVRYVIIGNYGAYEERASGAFLSAEKVNVAFEALGVRYDAQWTNDPAKLAIEVTDPALGPAGALTPEKVAHFYQFSPLRPDVRVMVSATRKDLGPDVPRSSVVFTSATGAMALNKYLSPNDKLDDASQMTLKLDEFLKAATARIPADRATLLVISDPSTSDSRRAMEALAASSVYTGIPMEVVEVAKVPTLRPADLATHAGVVLAVAEVASPSDAYLAGLLRDHLGHGGRVAALLPLRNPALVPVLTQGGPGVPQTMQGSGLRFRAGSFPGLGGFEIAPDKMTFQTFRPALGPDCRVLADAVANDGAAPVPLWWRCPAGRGHTVALNAFELVDRSALGFVVQATLEAEGMWAMPALSAAVEFVDDCPLPMTGGAPKSIGKTDTEFYRDDFYAMVREAVQKFHIRPTFLAVFSYDDKVRAPFGEPFAGPAGWAARDLMAHIQADDLPIGLHGWNHMSPAVAGGVTKHFPDKAALRAWYAAGRDSLSRIAGPTVRATVYVPPNDWIDATAKEAMVAEIPGMQVLAAVFNATEVETEQDFGPDPDQPSLIDLPRTWAGYSLSGEAALGLVNGLLLMAVNTHFIHPDDAMDPERSGGLSWAALRQAYLDGTEEVRKRFPFLRELTAGDAGRELSRIASTGWTAAPKPGGLEVTRSPGASCSGMWMVRTPAGCGQLHVTGGIGIAVDPESGVNIVRMDHRAMTLRCQPEKGSSP